MPAGNAPQPSAGRWRPYKSDQQRALTAAFGQDPLGEAQFALRDVTYVVDFQQMVRAPPSAFCVCSTAFAAKTPPFALRFHCLRG